MFLPHGFQSLMRADSKGDAKRCRWVVLSFESRHFEYEDFQVVSAVAAGDIASIYYREEPCCRPAASRRLREGQRR